ncbi:MAG: hypothetical protein KKF56_04135 [Nanoarchaeota archaeon]|nr:hypothetical protein [Nanoarchaeota archaeon]
MAIGEDFDIASSALFGSEVDFNFLILRVLFGILLIIIGILLGKIVKYGLKKLSDRLELEKNIKQSFIDLILTVIKWSIYVIFINLALFQVPIPSFTNAITNILVVIPAFTASLVLIAIGFGIAVYLREVIEDSEINGWRILSQFFFIFILYIFGVYALKISLVSLDNFFTNIIIVVLTIIAGIGITYYIIKNEGKHHRDKD